MALIFKHAVKYNGKFYPANTPIEEAAPKAAENAQANKPEAAPKAAKGRKKGDV